MISRQRYRCWAAADPRTETRHTVPHFRDAEAAYRWFVDDLLHDTLQVSLGRIEQHQIRARSLDQFEYGCWILRCNGCNRQFIDTQTGQRHWPNTLDLVGSARRAGWDELTMPVLDDPTWIHLCPVCRPLVIPLRRQQPVLRQSAPTAG